VTFLKNSAGTIDQALRLDGRRDRALGKLGLGVCSGVNVPLSPRFNGSGAAGQDGGTIENADCGGDVAELDVVENKRSGKGAVCGIRVTDEDGRVFYYGVDDRFRTDSLYMCTLSPVHERLGTLFEMHLSSRGGPSCQQIKSNLAIVNGNTLECPSCGSNTFSYLNIMNMEKTAHPSSKGR
jgi:hypothetical protein